MRKILFFDTSVGTLNIGDYIINNSINEELGDLFVNDFIVRYSTHQPVQKLYQKIRPNRYSHCADLKFLCGTNIFATNLLRPVCNFNINIFDTDIYRNSISIGCGIGRDRSDSTFNYYTKKIYKKILSHDFVHSVRDQVTCDFLNSLGFDAINTGCTTLWKLTPEHCKKIPKSKGKSVIFTLTDYCKDLNKDRILIETLKRNYESVYYWIQGSGDLSYFESLGCKENIIIVPPSLESFREVLLTNEIDYIGTRLHAGIFSLQNFKRTIIVSVDHRAADMSATHNLPIIERTKLDHLGEMINNPLETNIRIDPELIEKWKSQFEGTKWNE